MESIELLTAVLEDGIRNTNFFNGRLLTADDLRTEQQANRQQHQQIGQAIGAGVVDGLQVEIAAALSPAQSPPIPRVRVTAGLAVNRQGQTLALPSDVEIALVRESQVVAAEAGRFADCTIPITDTLNPDTGAYILVMAPASGFQGQVPMRGLRDVDTVTGCGSRYAVEGVQFRLVALELEALTRISEATREALRTLMAASGDANLSKLRNMLAHLVFGTEEVADFPRVPFARERGVSPQSTYGALEALRSLGRLTDGDVPLALLYWTPDGIRFIDVWAVRRQPEPALLSPLWPLSVGERRLAEAEATFLQFQAHMQWLLTEVLNASQTVRLRALDYFRYLPAVGVLPLSSSRRPGISVLTFFNQLPHRSPEFIDGNRLAPLIREAAPYSPISVETGEMVWLYTAWQARQAFQAGEDVAPYVLFTSKHLPYRAEARFDVSRWNYSNYTRL